MSDCFRCEYVFDKVVDGFLFPGTDTVALMPTCAPGVAFMFFTSETVIINDAFPEPDARHAPSSSSRSVSFGERGMFIGREGRACAVRLLKVETAAWVQTKMYTGRALV